ncbi:MAG: TRAP transporter small permease [Marivita sp.]|uniref:TRAP transporter small permease n=1 Tax=Marivita sp. TaxID=2003365 RepID=UPI0025C5471D|nr:TRAP transporter small permease [Marivita sp.]MCI5109843.1 TRAP transporter small permease [Marivita sp.]
MTMQAFDRLLGTCLRGIAMMCLGTLFLLLLINVVARTFELAGFSWFDEIVRGCFAWMVFIGAAALWRENDHFQVDWLQKSLTTVGAKVAHTALIGLVSLAFLLVMTWYGYVLFDRANAMTPILRIPERLFYAAIPISGAIMTAYTLVRLFRGFFTPTK